MLPLRAWVDEGVIAIKRYPAFPQTPALLEAHHMIVSSDNQDTRVGVS